MGPVRFEAAGRGSGRELVRAVAHQFAKGGFDSDQLCAAVEVNLGGEPSKKSAVLKALLLSPMIGSELDLTCPLEIGRKVDI